MLSVRGDFLGDFEASTTDDPPKVEITPFPHLARLSIHGDGEFVVGLLQALEGSPLTELWLSMGGFHHREELPETLFDSFKPTLGSLIVIDRQYPLSLSFIVDLVDHFLDTTPGVIHIITGPNMWCLDGDPFWEDNTMEQDVRILDKTRYATIRKTLDFGEQLLGQRQAMRMDVKDLLAALDTLEGLRRIYNE